MLKPAENKYLNRRILNKRNIGGGKIKMCESCNKCFSEKEKTKLKDKGWTEEQTNFAEDSVIEDKIKELIK